MIAAAERGLPLVKCASCGKAGDLGDLAALLAHGRCPACLAETQALSPHDIEWERSTRKFEDAFQEGKRA